MQRVKKRLAVLEAIPRPGKYADVERLISERTYYDELTEAQKQRYFEYAQSTRRADFEAALVSILGDTHIWLMAVDGNFDQIIEELHEIAQERNVLHERKTETY